MSFVHYQVGMTSSNYVLPQNYALCYQGIFSCYATICSLTKNGPHFDPKSYVENRGFLRKPCFFIKAAAFLNYHDLSLLIFLWDIYNVRIWSFVYDQIGMTSSNYLIPLAELVITHYVTFSSDATPGTREWFELSCARA